MQWSYLGPPRVFQPCQLRGPALAVGRRPARPRWPLVSRRPRSPDRHGRHASILRRRSKSQWFRDDAFDDLSNVRTPRGRAHGSAPTRDSLSSAPVNLRSTRLVCHQRLSWVHYLLAFSFYRRCTRFSAAAALNWHWTPGRYVVLRRLLLSTPLNFLWHCTITAGVGSTTLSGAVWRYNSDLMLFHRLLIYEYIFKFTAQFFFQLSIHRQAGGYLVASVSSVFFFSLRR